MNFDNCSKTLLRLAKRFTALAPERMARSKANESLTRLTYCRSFSDLPLVEIQAILQRFGFKRIEFCDIHFEGDRKELSFQVGPRTVLFMSWERIVPSDEYKLTAYLS